MIENIDLGQNGIEKSQNFSEKHANWINQAKESASHLHDFGLRTLMTITLLTFTHQEAKHLMVDPRYDFKSTLGYGLYLRGRSEAPDNQTTHFYDHA